MDTLSIIIAGAILTEAIIDVMKTWFSHLAQKDWALSLWAVLASVIGIIIAFTLQINIIDLIKVTTGFSYYIGIIASGIVIGRGANFVYDLFSKLQNK